MSDGNHFYDFTEKFRVA